MKGLDLGWEVSKRWGYGEEKQWRRKTRELTSLTGGDKTVG
jgi:hypothetical protein